jgi:hypothetical protein
LSLGLHYHQSSESTLSHDVRVDSPRNLCATDRMGCRCRGHAACLQMEMPLRSVLPASTFSIGHRIAAVRSATWRLPSTPAQAAASSKATRGRSSDCETWHCCLCITQRRRPLPHSSARNAEYETTITSWSMHIAKYLTHMIRNAEVLVARDLNRRQWYLLPAYRNCVAKVHCSVASDSCSLFHMKLSDRLNVCKTIVIQV